MSPLICMQPLMSLQMINNFERFLTNAAWIRAFTCMQLLMSLQMKKFFKQLLANTAWIWAFISMYKKMRPETGSCGEWLLTYTAWMWVFTCLDPVMHLEVRISTQQLRGNTAQIWGASTNAYICGSSDNLQWVVSGKCCTFAMLLHNERHSAHFKNQGYRCWVVFSSRQTQFMR